MQHIAGILSDSPIKQGYQDSAWTVPLIAHHARAQLDFTVSRDTVVRALKDMGYTYKRPSKTVPGTAPSPEEKRSAMRRMAEEVKELTKKKDSVVYALDESHFSTEPYLVRGWFKKRWPPQDSNEPQTRKSHVLWLLESHNAKILLEKIQEV